MKNQCKIMSSITGEAVTHCELGPLQSSIIKDKLNHDLLQIELFLVKYSQFPVRLSVGGIFNLDISLFITVILLVLSSYPRVKLTLLTSSQCRSCLHFWLIGPQSQ